MRFRASPPLLLILLAIRLAVPAHAQIPPTARALGMGGAYVGLARGYETLYLNPANLGLADAPRWSIALSQVTAGATIAGPPFGDLPDFLELDDISEERRNQIFAEVPGSGAEVDLDVLAPLFVVQRGRLAVGVARGVVGQHSFSRDLIDLLLFGYEEGRSDYRFGNTLGARMTYWDVAAGYGNRIGPVSWGVTGHYIRGGTLVRSWLNEPRIDLAARDIEIDYVGVLSRGGQGFSLDVGVAHQPSPSLTLSVAVSHLLSTVDWSDDLFLRSVTLTKVDFGDTEPLDLLKRYESNERRLQPAEAALTRGLTAADLQRDAHFPAVGTFGVAWRAPSGTDLGFSFRNSFTDGGLGDSWDRVVSLGVQQRLPLIMVRAGLASNLDDGSMFTGGLTLGPMELGIAKLNDGRVEGIRRSGWVGSFGLGVKTRSFVPD